LAVRLSPDRHAHGREVDGADARAVVRHAGLKAKPRDDGDVPVVPSLSVADVLASTENEPALGAKEARSHIVSICSRASWRR
jgi:hypothetical protein